MEESKLKFMEEIVSRMSDEELLYFLEGKKKEVAPFKCPLCGKEQGEIRQIDISIWKPAWERIEVESSTWEFECGHKVDRLTLEEVK